MSDLAAELIRFNVQVLANQAQCDAVPVCAGRPRGVGAHSPRVSEPEYGNRVLQTALRHVHGGPERGASVVRLKVEVADVDHDRLGEPTDGKRVQRLADVGVDVLLLGTRQHLDERVDAGPSRLAEVPKRIELTTLA